MAKRTNMEATDGATVSIAIDNSILTELKRDPVLITLQLSLAAESHNGKLKLRARLLRPRLKRQKAEPGQSAISGD